MLFLCFIELNRCDRVPSRVVVDDAAEIGVGKYMHVKFEKCIFFEFGADEQGSEDFTDRPFACIDKAVVEANQSFSNEYHVPILYMKRIVGAMKCKISSVSTIVNLDCRKIVFSRRPIWIGHRGSGANKAGRRIMENTLLSFNEAMRQPGLAGIELDVTLTDDKKLVVFHDLEYPARVNGRMANLPIPSLYYCDMQVPRLQRSVSLGAFTGTSSGMISEDCPQLEQVLKHLRPETAGLVIELKYPTNKYVNHLGKYSRTALVEAVLKCLDDNQEHIKHRWIALSSFDPDIVWMLHSSLSHPSNVTVVHNVWFGHEYDAIEDNTVHFAEARNLVPSAAIEQARLLNGGIAVEAAYALTPAFHEAFRYAHDTPVLSYGTANLSLENIRSQTGVSAFFVDDMRLINKQ